MKLSYGKLFSLAVHIVLIVVATWLLVLAVFEDVTMDARLGRLAVALACIANLFPERKRIRGALFIAAVALVVIASFVFIYK